MKPQIKKSELLKYLEEGLSRAEIAAKYEVTTAEMLKYFKLLNIKAKAKRKLKFEVIDDTILPFQLPKKEEAGLEAHI